MKARATAHEVRLERRKRKVEESFQVQTSSKLLEGAFELKEHLHEIFWKLLKESPSNG